MGKPKKAKKESGVNIDADAVKKQFEKLSILEGIVLTSTTPQMKDLGKGEYRYTMWGIDKEGKRGLVIMSADRNHVKCTNDYSDDIKTVTGEIVAKENQKFATARILASCAFKGLDVTSKTAMPIMIPSGTKVHYGYAMCANQGSKNGFVTMETGSDVVNFTDVSPKIFKTQNG